MRALRCSLMIVVALSLGSALAEESPPYAWKAGTATAKITPQRPMAMAGYAGRKDNPSEGTEQDLFAKALAMEDEEGNRALLITMDLIGVIDRLRDAVVEQVSEAHGVPANSIVMNASHTHCGPAYGREEASDYFDLLSSELVRISAEAFESLAPASLTYNTARCGFAMNRRTPTPTGFRNHPNPEGQVDHEVPVLKVTRADGELLAVVFGYSCHATTMGFMNWLGDWPGYAQEYFEADHPGTTALFMNGCSGDQNPYPRSMLYFAQRHGRSLATAVEAAIEFNQNTPLHQKPVAGPIRSTFREIELEFRPGASREPSPYPVQILQFGEDLAMITLGNEVVVGYSLRLKEELGGKGPAIWVAGYSNSYDGYIPTKRILEEGGYEADSRPYALDVEERIVTAVHEAFRELNPQ